MITILLADDHSLMRAGLKRILEDEPDMQVVAEASDGLEAVETYQRIRPTVIILDISMPKMDGLEVLRRILELDPKVRILFLTVYPEKQYGARVLKAGALGYVTKGICSYDLPQAVRTVAGGRKYISDEAKDILAMQALVSRSDLAPLERLSNRELQVLRLIARGSRTRQIANQLGVSIKTVHTYRVRLLEKLGLESNADLCRFAFEQGLTETTAAP
jgi:DNA-binding NarL/FixJ family response regulator